jgi:beta-1,4-mannosyl-glycoprotein beta-1,4-N-acetylglucosaminyltransferase
MKIFDCFMYYDEDLILDLRLNYLNDYVDKFIIVESSYTHSGVPKKLLFDINKYLKFKNKINYIILDTPPLGLQNLSEKDNEHQKNSKYILNAVKRENLQRDTIIKGLDSALPDDIIIISDVDEIPNLEENNIKTIKNKIILFKQKFFYYKFNLKLSNYIWHGSKACKKKNLISPQWLRNVKDKIYPFWRFDTLFSNKKYQNIKFINNGGWHFSNIKTPANIEKKMKTYLHHREYELNPIGEKKISEIIKQKKPIYNLKTDMRSNKFDLADELIVAEIDELPYYIQTNINKYKNWLN